MPTSPASIRCRHRFTPFDFWATKKRSLFTLVESRVAHATTGRQLFPNSERPFRLASFTLIELLGRRQRPFRFASFTLIELLVVIAIIAILAALLLPALSKARSNVTALTCNSNLRQVSIGIRMYLDDNQEYYPVIRHETGGWWHQEGIIHEYTGQSDDIFHCPNDEDPTTLSYNFVWFGGGAFWHTTTNPYYEGYHMRVVGDKTRVFGVDITDPDGGLLQTGLFGSANTEANPDNNYMIEGTHGGGWGAGYGIMEMWHAPRTHSLAVDLSVRATNLQRVDYQHYMSSDPAQHWYRTAGTMVGWPYELSARFSGGLWD